MGAGHRSPVVAALRPPAHMDPGDADRGHVRARGARGAPPAIWLLMVGLVMLNTIAATQDVATDGMAVEMLPSSERGARTACRSRAIASA